MQPDPNNATLVYREDLTDVLSIVKVRPDTGRVPAFVPGQFVRLGLPRGAPAPVAAGLEAEVGRSAVAEADADALPIRGAGRVRYTRRAYSIASSPNEADALEFFVVRVDEGALTPRLWELAVGERIWVDHEAKGEFTLDLAHPEHNPAHTGRDLVMMATGTGIAPFISMLRTYRGQGRWRRFIVIHGARYAADLGYRGELETAAAEDPTIVYIPLLTREPAGSLWRGLRGRVQTVLEPEIYERLVGSHFNPTECHVFLCGNPQMIDEVDALLADRGFTTDSRHGRGNVHFERYW